MSRYWLLPILLVLLGGCGGGSGGGKPNPATGANWDEMHWDAGRWE